MNRIVLALAIISVVGLTACKKEAGSGGTSSITGNVSGRMYTENGGNAAEKEVTQIIIPDGSDINDAEYILLNTPNNGSYYYVWFKWNNGVQPDPFLAGRTGIQVTYDFTESNTDIAANVAAAISSIAGTDFDVTVNNDIVTLTNIAPGETPDADELSSNILVDVQNQGQGAIAGSSSYIEGAIVDERVYLIYGDDDFYSESVRTDASGNYQFTGLNRGTYRVYAFTADTLNPGGILGQVEVSVEISEKKEVVQAPGLYVVKF